MNWIEIKEKYPKAWNSLIQYSKDNEQVFSYLTARYELGMDEDEVMSDLSIRDLYDFFDDNGINITLGRNIVSFYWCVSYDNTVQEQFIRDPHEIIKLRTEAEQAAFTKAFEILNNKLK